MANQAGKMGPSCPQCRRGVSIAVKDSQNEENVHDARGFTVLKHSWLSIPFLRSWTVIIIIIIIIIIFYHFDLVHLARYHLRHLVRQKANRGKVNVQLWVEMKRLLEREVMKGHIPWTYWSKTKFKDIISIRVGISLGESHLSTATRVCTLAFYLFIIRLYGLKTG